MILTKKPSEEYGTDITALLWKIFQSTQIQKQLDLSHNLYKLPQFNFNNNNNNNTVKNLNNNTNNNNTNPCNLKDNNISTSKKSKIIAPKTNNNITIARKKEKNLNKNPRSVKLLIKNLDKLINRSDEKNSVKKKKNNRQLIKNVYSEKLLKLYDAIALVDSPLLELDKINYDEYIYKQINEHLVNSPLTPQNILGDDYAQDIIFKNDTENSFSNIANFINIRKSKIWVLYLLSDGIPRYGTIHPHPVYNLLPGWLFDALQIIGNLNMHLIYSTDLRGVNTWMGELANLINIHNLLSIDIEKNGFNCTLILMHIVGLFSSESTNPISRQGIKFPDSILQKTTFENVKNLLSAAIEQKQNYDNLCSFISSTIACIPHKSGSNSFNLLMK